MPEQALPDIVSSIGPFGHRAGDDALPKVPVLAVMGDSHAALFGHAGWRSGLVKATYGTGTSVMAVSTVRAGPPPGSARQWPGRSALSQFAPSRATSEPVAPPSPGSPS